MAKPHDPDRVTISTYTNKKGQARVSALMSRDLALRIAADDLDALDKVRVALKTRIEREEADGAS